MDDAAAREVVASASGKLWSFVDARELRNVLGQLIAAELLRMSLADLLTDPTASAPTLRSRDAERLSA